MKKLFALPLAVFFVAACSESTAPESAADLTPSYGKPVNPPTGETGGCTTCPVDGFYDFEGGVVANNGGTSVATDLQPEGQGTASDALVVEAPTGESFLGRFENVRTMVVINVPAGHPKYSLTFDFYAIGSWDGRGKQAQNGAFDANVFDLAWRCTPASPATSIFKTTFSNQKTVQQDYPLAYLTGGYKAASGSFEQDGLDYISHPELSHTPVFRSYGDVSYHMGSAGANPCGTGAFQLLISTSNPTQQSVMDESWGVDNIRIKAGT